MVTGFAFQNLRHLKGLSEVKRWLANANLLRQENPPIVREKATAMNGL
ncbi:hypothetical protein [Methylobacterium sp. 10]|nr:hypothetical protein [Methylobacterium sp. 10]